MANYVSLDEAAKLLGLSSNELIEMRSRGEIFGFRDGSSWKFKTDEIERVRQELSGDVLDDDAGGSSILVSERAGGSKSGIVLTGDNKGSNNSDLHLDADDGLGLGSDVALVPDPSSGSGLRLVTKGASGSKGGSDLRLEGDEEELEVDASSLSLGEESGMGLAMDSELRLADDSQKSSAPAAKSPAPSSDDSDILGGSDVKLTPTSKTGGAQNVADDSDGDLGLGDELKLSPSDDDDDLVLSSGSDLALGGDSGINLMAPSDSGLSLEDEEPLDLEGAGISGLDLGSSAGSDVDVGGAAASGSGSGSGGSGAGLSGIDFGAAAGEDFQLSPSGGFDVDEDSGSQVIEIEDSTDLGGFPADDFPAAEGGFLDEGMAVGAGAGVGAAGAAAYRGSPEVPLATWEVFTLLSIVMLLGLSGLLVTDIVRNMWAWNGESDASITSWFTRMIISSVRMEG